MNTVACYKVVPDAQDVRTVSGAAPDIAGAERVLGEYDLMAMEAAVTLATQTDGRAVLLSAGGNYLEDTKLCKAALSRGADELFYVIDGSLEDADAWQTAQVLADALADIDFDVVICGEGSADQYAQMVGPLLGALLELPTLNAVCAISAQGEGLRVQRVLEDVVETIDVPVPCVLCVTSDANVPRIPTLKDILAAGKKPVNKGALEGAGRLPESTIECISVSCPADADRKHVIYESADDEAIAAVASAIRAAC